MEFIVETIFGGHYFPHLFQRESVLICHAIPAACDDARFPGKTVLTNEFLSTLQWKYCVRQVLNGSWRKFQTWTKLEPSVQTLPLPSEAVLATAGYAVQCNLLDFGVAVLLGFHCTLPLATLVRWPTIFGWR